MVLSEIYYPGWTATIDGEPTEINLAYDILRSVTLGEGEHIIVFSFTPLSIYIGFVLAAGCWFCILLIILQKKL